MGPGLPFLLTPTPSRPLLRAPAGSGVNAQPRAGLCFLKHLLLPPEGLGSAAKMLCLDGKSPPREENLSGRGIRERGGVGGRTPVEGEGVG